MKKRVHCEVTADIYFDVEIPDNLAETFESNIKFDYWYQTKDKETSNKEEIYELLNNKIQNNIHDLDWSSIEVYDEEDIKE